MLPRVLRLIAAVAVLITVSATGAAGNGGPPRAVLTFGKLAKVVAATVQHDFPDAVWTRAWADTSSGDVDSIGSWHFEYGAEADGEPVTIRAEANLDGLVGLLKLVREPSSADLALPLSVAMEPEVADDLLNDAGYRAPYRSVVLRHPSSPQVDNPLWVFGFEGGGFVAVDTLTGVVERVD